MNVISPNDVEPTINPNSSPEATLRSVHRRVISPKRGGPKGIDVGYNVFKAGLENTTPYAYNRDEICYTSAGEMHSTSGGVTVIQRHGMFMWRPAGTSSEHQSVRADTITLCAFAPAREEDWSHRLLSSEFGIWDAVEENKPVPHYFHYSAITPSQWPGSSREGDVVHRRVISQAKDNSRYMELSHSTIEAGASVRMDVSGRDEVWWLESGGVIVATPDGELVLSTGEFLYRAAGESVDDLTVNTRAVLICFSAPAAGSAFSS